MEITYKLTSSSSDFITDILPYYLTDLKNSYSAEGHSYMILSSPNQIIIITNSSYIFNSDGFLSESKKYNCIISEEFIYPNENIPQYKTLSRTIYNGSEIYKSEHLIED